MRERIEYEDLGDIELDPAMSAKVDAMVDEAEREFSEVRVTVRWGREQLEMVRQAARQRGVPYQVYIKDAVYERAFADVSAHLDYEQRRQAVEARSGG